jgi:polysaccharide deacetylase 2 family uncharacterized protein YibQ
VTGLAVSDDLNAPLGQDAPRKRRLALPIAIPHLIAGALGLMLLVFVGWAIMADNPLGGEPVVIATNEVRTVPAAKKAEPAPVPMDAAPSRHDGPDFVPGSGTAQPGDPAAAGNPATAGKTVTIIDGTSGNRQEVPISGAAEAPPVRKPEAKLLEKSRHGEIPRIGEDGARPSEIYARAAAKPKAATADTPRVALVVGGLGVGASSTAEALAKLPGPVTLAFAPYGADLDRLVTRARGEGHEVLLQVPMEPFDYPDNDPGPQTLLTSLAAEQNVDRLYWLMSRFQGYVGIVNYMGARFTATEQAFAPVLREAAKRGLIYMDDGSSPRSIAGQIAGANNLPFAKADVVLDAVPTPAEIDRALSRLEAVARDRGLAVGMASALPISIERLAAWAKSAEGRGITLVPVSAIAVKAKSS